MVIKELNRSDSPDATAVTLSKGLPVTFDIYASSSPPKPTRSSASTWNGSAVGFHSRSTIRRFEFVAPCGAGTSTVEALQKGMKEEYEGTSETIE